MSRHHLFDPDGMASAVGFSYGAVTAPGRHLYIAGITAQAEDGSISGDIVDQFGTACAAVAKVVVGAGGTPSDLVSMTIYTTDIEEYLQSLEPLGERYRSVFGRHFPPMALIEVSRLFDPAALVELVCVAVVGD